MLKKLCFPLIFLATVIQAKDPKPVELIADLSKGDMTYYLPKSFEKGEINVTITNMLPDDKYQIAFDSVRIFHKPLEVKSETRDVDLDKEQKEFTISPCDKLKTEIYQLTDEAKLPEKLSEYKQGGCDKSDPIDLHTKMSKLLYLSSNENLTLSINRKEESKDISWNYKWNVKQTSYWIYHFGFSFTSKNKDQYFIKANGDDHNITKKEDRDGYDYLPSLMFSYYDESWPSLMRGTQLAITTGLNFEKDNIALFMGPSLVIGDNFLLTVGPSVRREKVLDGRYNVGDSVASDFSEDKLYEDAYKFRWHIALGYRFGGGTPTSHKEVKILQ
ncbi:MAG: hypothetical protein K0U47_03835 [Epsilonproteobacteria bacterium]|nr:hypothetical protein [Campylobacterota bacterium]